MKISIVKSKWLSLFFVSTTSLMISSYALEPKGEIHIQKIDKYLSQSTTTDFSASILVARDGDLLLNKGYGWADKENRVANTQSTVFDIGSLSKQFTGAAILKLVEQGKVKVTNTLDDFFENLPKDKRQITLHQLLTHSSGVSEMWGKTDFDIVETNEFFKDLLALPLVYQPGTSYEYSNAGYSILGRIIELVSGDSYERFLQKHFFKPLGMTQTGYLEPDWSNSLIAKGYRWGLLPEGTMVQRYQQAGEISWILKGNGGIHSTTQDLFKWYLALKNHKALPKHLVATLTSPHVAENPEGDSHYGYGWAVFNSPRNTKVIAHNGSNRIFFADMLWLDDEDTVIIMLSNTASRGTFDLAWEIEKMLFNPNYAAKPVRKDMEAELIGFIEKTHADALAQGLVERFSDKIRGPSQLNEIGYTYSGMGKANTAIALFEANTLLYPNDGNVWDSLGEGYYLTGQYQKAKESFTKALAMGKGKECNWCENSQQYLNKIAK